MSFYGDNLCSTDDCKNDVNVYSDDASPVDTLVVNWGYEPIMPRNVVVWDELPMATHVIVGIYLFAVGECDILLGRHYIKSVYS